MYITSIILPHFQAAPLAEHRLVATWSERGVVSVWDVSKHMILLDSPSVSGGASGKILTGHKETPLFTFSGHQVSLSYTHTACTYRNSNINLTLA